MVPAKHELDAFSVDDALDGGSWVPAGPKRRAGTLVLRPTDDGGLELDMQDMALEVEEVGARGAVFPPPG